MSAAAPQDGGDRPPHEEIERRVGAVRRALGIRPPAQVLPETLVGPLRKSLQAAADGRLPDPDRALRAHYDRVRSARRLDFDFCFCLMLLEQLPVVPEDGEAAEAVVRTLRDCYDRCGPSQRPQVHVELLARCRSSNEFVRRVACRLLALDPLTVTEVGWLSEPMGFPDVQFAVADRVLARPHAHAAFLEPWLRFLLRTLRAEGGAPVAHRERALALLTEVHRFGFQTAGVPLFREFVQERNFANPECRGALLEALAGFRGEIVPHLESPFHGSRAARGPVLRLLRHLCRTSAMPEATRLMWKLARSVPPGDFERDVRPALEDALADLRAAPEGDVKGYRWDVFEEEAEATRNDPDPGRRRFAQGVRRPDLPSEPVTLEFVRRCCQKGTAPADKARLRGPAGWDLVARVLTDPTEPVPVRARAARLLVTIQGRRESQRPAQTRDLLWAVYCREPALELRVAALAGLAEVSAPRDEYNLRLAADCRSGEPDLRRKIEDLWPSLFPDVLPPDPVGDAGD